MAASQFSMPIREIFLYDNGYAVFRREAEVKGSGQVNLFFHRSQVNSVLESLRLFGEASSKIGNIAYEPTKPKANVQIGSPSPYIGLLGQLKGLQVKMVICNEEKQDEHIGRLLGVNELFDVASKTYVNHVILFVEPSEVRSLPLHAICSLQVLSDRMQHDLSHALDLATTSENDEIQKLSFFFSDVPSVQSLKAQYGLVTTDWKSTYRLIFKDDSLSKFHLDGMAVVENNLDEDWTNVQLTLVVGAPPLNSAKSSGTTGTWSLIIKHFTGSSFTLRCNPKDTIMSIKLKIYEMKKGPHPNNFKLLYAGKALDAGRLVSDYTISDRSVLNMEISSGTSNVAVENENVEFVMSSLDSLSFYPITSKVTAQRKQKAIVPMLQTTLEAQNVVLYSEMARRGNPLSAVLFANSTGRTLDGGKIQLYKGDQFLGGGDLPTLHPGDESPPIPYAVKMGCEVLRETATKYLPFHTLSIDDGEIRLVRKRHQISIYRIRNKTEEALDFLLDHIFLDGYDLVREDLMDEAGEPVDITDKVYQFRFVVEARDEKKKFVITEECEEVDKTHIRDLTEEHMVIRKNNEKKWLDAPTFEVLEETLALRKKIRSMERDIYTKEDDMREVQDNQVHLRQNITALEGNKAEAAKYIKSLAAEEDRLKALRQSIKKERQDKKELNEQLERKMRAIKFSKKLV